MKTNKTKEKYVKPSVRVVELQHRTMLLQASATGTNAPRLRSPYDKHVGRHIQDTAAYT